MVVEKDAKIILEQLKFRNGTDEYKKRIAEIAKNKDELNNVKEVNYLGDKFEITGRQTILQVKIFNPTLGVVSEYTGVEYVDVCPVDGKPMLVRMVKNATLVPVCSVECQKILDKVLKEIKESKEQSIQKQDEVKKE
jgi:hypothetical protein